MRSDESTTGPEIRMSRPFRSIAHEGAVSLLRTASVVRYGYELAAQAEGLTLQQYNVLRILRGAGESVATMDIGERLIERMPGITRLLDRLEAKGLIRRQRCPSDRRRVLCDVTPEGLDVLERLQGPFERLDEASLAGLTREEQAHLVRLLQKIRDGLGEAVAAASPPETKPGA